MNLKYYTVGIFTVVVFTCSLAFAEDTKVHYYVQTPGQRVLSSPNGEELAIANQRTPVEILEEKDGWVKVSITGWMRDASLASNLSAPMPSDKPLQPVEHLRIVGFDVKHISRKESGNPSKVILTIQIKNLQKTTIGKWDAILIVQDASGNLLFRTRITPEKTRMTAGETAEFSYFWIYGQEIYDHLASKDKNDLKLLLHNVVLE
ncbi:MAG: hypothetical protein IT291_00100 [Deltaproteobacteria bacterium]|nr:hypothetical protein [Deltaproteobacteria bacterium]